MTIPPKCEDLYLKIAELERRESDLMEKIARAGRVSFSFFEERDAALAREAALREELDRHKSLYNQLEKALSRVHCMYGKRLLDLTGERQTVLVPDEEFVKYFEELKCLKVENSALQQRLTVAEQLLKRFDSMFSGGICSGPLQDLVSDVRAALKPAAEGEGS